MTQAVRCAQRAGKLKYGTMSLQGSIVELRYHAFIHDGAGQMLTHAMLRGQGVAGRDMALALLFSAQTFRIVCHCGDFGTRWHIPSARCTTLLRRLRRLWRARWLQETFFGWRGRSRAKRLIIIIIIGILIIIRHIFFEFIVVLVSPPFP